MAGSPSRCVLGEDWYEGFVSCRLNPEMFLEKRKLTREAFCLHILKDLNSDYIEMQCKINLLLLLQEKSMMLIKNITLLEQIVGTLQNLYHHIDSSSDKSLLKSQILISVTTILLVWNKQEAILRHVLNIKVFLLKIFLDNSEDPLVVSTASQCLEEIELYYPKILRKEFTNLLTACEKHMSPAVQSFVMLLNTCTKHIFEKNISDSDKGSDTSQQQVAGDIQTVPSVSYLLEQLPSMSETLIYKVLKNLIFIVKHSNDLPSSTFKRFLPNFIKTYSAPLFHLCFDLLEAFGDELFSAEDEENLLHQLVVASTHPSLDSLQRLLHLNWLQNLLEKKAFSVKISNSDIKLLLPNQFDDTIIQEKKLCALSAIISSNASPEAVVEFLNDTSSGLKKYALRVESSKAATSFFKTLFEYFSSHHTQLLSESVYSTVLDAVKAAPHLSLNALKFFQAIKGEGEEKVLFEKALQNLVEHIIQMPLKQFMMNTEHYLPILDCAAQKKESICKPRAILKLLQRLLSESTLEKNSWILGNNILTVCCTILKFHNKSIYYYDLAEVLCLIMKNIDDVDVKSRAKVYYSSLTCLSDKKVQDIFAIQPFEKGAKKSLKTFVTDSSINLKLTTNVQKLSEPVLKLTRAQDNFRLGSNEADFEMIDFPDEDMLTKYQEFISQNNFSVTIPLILEHINDSAENFSTLYGIVITSDSRPKCKNISVIKKPVFKKQNGPTGSNKTCVYLKLSPSVPHPLKIFFSAQFTCANGYSYTSELQPMDIEFCDIFVPLPISMPSEDTWKEKVFELLWNKFYKAIESENTELKCIQSAFRLDLDCNELRVLTGDKWGPFVVKKTVDPTYCIAIFLPPKNHILIKINIINESPFANIIVDDATVLPWLGLHLQSLKN